MEKNEKAKTAPAKKRKTPLRRKRGMGSVEAVGEKWRARRRRGDESVYGTLRETWEEADNDRASLKFADEASPIKKGTAPTLTEFCEHLLQNEIKREKAYATWSKYEIFWRTRIDVHRVGKMRLDRIEEEDLQCLLDEQRKHVQKRVKAKDPKPGKAEETRYVVTDERLARSSLRSLGAFLGLVFSSAKGKRYKYVKTNPAHGLEYPVERKAVKPRRGLTPRQAAGLEANLLTFLTGLRSQGERFEAMVLTARDTGMRRGELCGLRWDAIGRTREGPYVVVDRGRIIVQGGTEDSSTKSGRGREVPVEEETYALLLKQPRRSEYVFTTASGKPLRPDTFTRDFGNFRRAAGLPDLKLHGLRSTYVSLMLRAGVDLKTIQANVGHASPKMIMEVYGETFDESRRESSSRMRGVLDRAREDIQNDQKSA